MITQTHKYKTINQVWRRSVQIQMMMKESPSTSLSGRWIFSLSLMESESECFHHSCKLKLIFHHPWKVKVNLLSLLKLEVHVESESESLITHPWKVKVVVLSLMKSEWMLSLNTVDFLFFCTIFILSFPREPGVTLQKKATLPTEINLLSSLLVFRWKVDLI